MDFSTALESMKHGNAMARKGWNGKNQFVVLISEDLPPEILPFFAMIFMDHSNMQFGWLASQTDLLAKDWVEFTGESFDRFNFTNLWSGLRTAARALR